MRPMLLWGSPACRNGARTSRCIRTGPARRAWGRAISSEVLGCPLTGKGYSRAKLVDPHVQARRIGIGIGERHVTIRAHDVERAFAQLRAPGRFGPGKRLQRKRVPATRLDERFARAAIHVSLPLE